MNQHLRTTAFLSIEFPSQNSHQELIFKGIDPYDDAEMIQNLGHSIMAVQKLPLQPEYDVKSGTCLV